MRLCALTDTFLGMTKTRSKLSGGEKTARALRDQINQNRVVKDKKATMTEVYLGGGGGGGVMGCSEYSCGYPQVGKKKRRQICDVCKLLTACIIIVRGWR